MKFLIPRILQKYYFENSELIDKLKNFLTKLMEFSFISKYIKNIEHFDLKFDIKYS